MSNCSNVAALLHVSLIFKKNHSLCGRFWSFEDDVRPIDTNSVTPSPMLVYQFPSQDIVFENVKHTKQPLASIHFIMV